MCVFAKVSQLALFCQANQEDRDRYENMERKSVSAPNIIYNIVYRQQGPVRRCIVKVLLWGDLIVYLCVSRLVLTGCNFETLVDWRPLHQLINT